MRVAILQSDPQHRFVIGEIIERLSHVCIPFSDGLSMSKSLSRSTVDMLVLDWQSTGLSGLDLLKSMRSGIGDACSRDVRFGGWRREQRGARAERARRRCCGGLIRQTPPLSLSWVHITSIRGSKTPRYAATSVRK